jgi:acetyl esterase/lipase
LYVPVSFLVRGSSIHRHRRRRRSSTAALCVYAAAAAAVPAVASAADVVCRPPHAARATLLYLHPGGFVEGRAGDPGNLRICREFAAHGYLTRVVEYPLLDLTGAVRAANRAASREHGRAVAVGDSAGGTLALLLAAQGRVAAAASFGAPTDLLTWPTDQHAWDKFHTTTARRRAASPYWQVTARAAPALVMHDPRDIVVPFDQATRMAARMPTARLVRAKAAAFYHVWRASDRALIRRWLDTRVR